MRIGSTSITLGLALALWGCGGCDSKSTGARGSDAGTAVGTPTASAAQMATGVIVDPHVEEAVRSVRPELDACYRSAVKQDPKASGHALFRIIIAPDGKVTEVALDSATADAELVGCSRVALTHARFAPTANGQRTTLTVPIDYGAPGSASASAPAPL